MSAVSLLAGAQMRVWRNGLRRRSGRLGLLAALIFTLIWYGFWIAGAGVAVWLPAEVGLLDFAVVLPALLLFLLIYWQLVPLLTLSFGPTLGLERFAFLPLRAGELFAAELLLRAWSSAGPLLVLGGVTAGLARAGAPAANAVVACCSFALLNIGLTSAFRSLAEAVARRRLLRDLLVVGLVCLVALPQLAWLDEAADAGLAALPQAVSWALPSNLAADAAVSGRAAPAAALFVEALAALALSLALFRRSLETERRAAAPAVAGASRWLDSLPGVPGALLAKELRQLWRSSRFRTAFLMGFSFGVLIWRPLVGDAGADLERWALPLVALYAAALLAPTVIANVFGLDGAAAAVGLRAPIGSGSLLAAKNAAALVWMLAETGLTITAGALAGFPLGAREAGEAVAAVLTAFVWLAAAGNVLSIVLPGRANPDRLSSSGPGHGLRATIAFFFLPLALAPAAAPFVIAALGGPEPLAVMAVALALGSAVFAASFRWTARRLERRPEALLERLQLGADPIDAD